MARLTVWGGALIFDLVPLRAASLRLDLEPDCDAPSAPHTEGASDIEDVKARLAARGLLATRPAVVVPKEKTASAATAGPPDEGSRRKTAPPKVDPEGSWDVDHGDSQNVAVRCPHCRELRALPLQSTRFACLACDRAWRWAICEDCDELTLTVERQEAWRCTSCAHANRSWWRTPAAARDATVVVARRKQLAVQQRRAEIRAGMRRRRWKLVALGVVAAVTAVGVVVGVRMAEHGGASGTAATCAKFERLRAGLANGTVSAAALDTDLRALQVATEGADSEVIEAVAELRASVGSPAAFLMARTALADACHAAGA